MQGILFYQSEMSKSKTGSLEEVGSVSAHWWIQEQTINALGIENWLTGWWAGVILSLCQFQL